jgi:hypothetical protein
MEKIIININGQKEFVAYKSAAGALFAQFIPFLKTMDCATLRENVRWAYWILQVIDRKEYNRRHKKTWKWLSSVMKAKGDFNQEPVVKFVINSHLASIDMGLLRGFGLSKGHRTKGRTKVTGGSYSDPERYTIYPEITPKTEWPEVLKKKRFTRRQGAHIYKNVKIRGIK